MVAVVVTEIARRLEPAGRGSRHGGRVDECAGRIGRPIDPVGTNTAEHCANLARRGQCIVRRGPCQVRDEWQHRKRKLLIPSSESIASHMHGGFP
jgi:hypothetical protein